MYLLLPTERVSKAEKCPKLCRLISNKLSVEPAIIILSWLRCRIRSGGSATDPKLARLSLRLALVTGLRRSLSVSWLLPGMFSLPVRSAAHVERFLAEGTSTHWPKGTPKTGPGPGWPLDSRDLSENTNHENFLVEKIEIRAESFKSELAKISELRIQKMGYY